MSNRKLEGKVIIVTGAASGIGAGAAMEFLQQGAKVVMADRDEPKLLATCADLKEKTGGEAVTVVADVAKDDDNRRIVETAMSTFGALHMSFINAGVAIPRPILEMVEDVLDKIFGSNFKGVVFGLKHQIPAIAKTWDKGSIVVTSSITGSRIFSDMTAISAYASSKAAAEMMVKYGAVEGAPMNVRVNGVAPGAVRTPMALGMAQQGLDFPWAEVNLIKNEITIGNVVSTVMFLLSEDAQAVTGSIVRCDMGSHIKT